MRNANRCMRNANRGLRHVNGDDPPVFLVFLWRPARVVEIELEQRSF